MVVRTQSLSTSVALLNPAGILVFAVIVLVVSVVTVAYLLLLKPASVLVNETKTPKSGDGFVIIP